MNILIDLVPKTVKVLGKEYTINSNFRTFILFELLIQDESLSEVEKGIQALKLCYEDEIPPDLNSAIEGILYFYRGGKEENEIQGREGNGNYTQPYSYEYDAELIYSAFLSQYNIDLQDIEYLHWWKFKALFKGLSEEHEIKKAIKFRTMDLNKIKDKQEREYYRKMKEVYKLPISEEEQKRLDDLTNALLSGEDIKEFL